MQYGPVLHTEEIPDLGRYEPRAYHYGFELDGYIFWSGQRFATKQLAAMNGGKTMKKWFPPQEKNDE